MLSSRQNDELCLLRLRPQKQRWVLGLAARSFTEMSPDFVVPTDWIYKTSTRVHLCRLLPKPGRLDFCDFNKKCIQWLKKYCFYFKVCNVMLFHRKMLNVWFVRVKSVELGNLITTVTPCFQRPWGTRSPVRVLTVRSIIYCRTA